MSAPALSCRCKVGGHRTITTCTANGASIDADGGRAHQRGARARRPHRRRRHDRLRLLESAADESGRIAPFAGETALFITPGYRFRAVDLLLTNFHLPRSTLFMLVAAFAGLERMKAAYAHAVAAALSLLLLWRCVPAPSGRARAMSGVRLRPSGARRRGAARPHHDGAWHDRDAGLHAGRHGGDGEGDAARGCRRDRRRDHARQHLSPDAAARRRAHRARWAGCIAS